MADIEGAEGQLQSIVELLEPIGVELRDLLREQERTNELLDKLLEYADMMRVKFQL